MTTPTPEQLKQWRIKFLSEEGYMQEVPMPDAHNYKRVLQDARFYGYLRAKQESEQTIKRLMDILEVVETRFELTPSDRGFLRSFGLRKE